MISAQRKQQLLHMLRTLNAEELEEMYDIMHKRRFEIKERAAEFKTITKRKAQLKHIVFAGRHTGSRGVPM